MSLAFGGHIIAGLALNGSAVSACYNGQIVWPDAQMVKVNLSNTDDYLRMRFVDSTGGETAIEVGSGATATASASVPVGVTAYWTANGCQTGADTRYHVTGLGVSGFDAVSAETAVTTAFYADPSVMSYGSALLTASDSASAQADLEAVYRASFGEGSTNYYSTLSASSWAGTYLYAWGYATGREMWIPKGGKVMFSGSSVSGRTYDVADSLTSLSGYDITYSHRDIGTKSTVKGYMNEPRSFRLSNGRVKCVYATGIFNKLTTGTASAAGWRPYSQITGLSSNMVSGSSTSMFLEGSAAAGKIYGFPSSNVIGRVKNSAGTWSDVTGADSYCWNNNKYFSGNSGKMSAAFSAMRTKGATANNTDSYYFYGLDSANGTINIKSGTFAVPTASGRTASSVQTAASSTTVVSANVVGYIYNSVAQNTALCSNASGVWTASAVVR